MGQRGLVLCYYHSSGLKLTANALHKNELLWDTEGKWTQSDETEAKSKRQEKKRVR